MTWALDIIKPKEMSIKWIRGHGEVSHIGQEGWERVIYMCSPRGCRRPGGVGTGLGGGQEIIVFGPS